MCIEIQWVAPEDFALRSHDFLERFLVQRSCELFGKVLLSRDPVSFFEGS